MSKFIIFTIVISFYTSPIAKIQQNLSLLGAHFQISKCNMFGLISNCTASSRIPLNLLTSEISQNFELNFPRIVKNCCNSSKCLDVKNMPNFCREILPRFWRVCFRKKIIQKFHRNSGLFAALSGGGHFPALAELRALRLGLGRRHDHRAAHEAQQGLHLRATIRKK